MPLPSGRAPGGGGLRKLFRLGDALAKAVLRSPIHFLLSRYFIVVEFDGVKTGRRYRIGMSYRRRGDRLYAMTYRRRKWWRDLRNGRRVSVLYKGRAISATTHVEDFDVEAISRGLRERDIFRRTLYDVGPEVSVLIEIRLATGPGGSPATDRRDEERHL